MRFLRGDGRRSDYTWRFDRQRSLGVLGTLGSHMIDLAHWYVGDIVKVSARLTAFFDHDGRDGQPGDAANDSAMLLLEFAGGAQGTIHVSAAANVGERGMEQHVVLHGSAGTLELVRYASGTRTDELRGLTEGSGEFRTLAIPDDILGDANPHDWLDAFTKQSVGARHFIDSIVKDTLPSPAFHDGVKVQAVLDAAIEAHQRGAWVSVSNNSIGLPSGSST
jgi:predicted dehydrogenase